MKRLHELLAAPEKVIVADLELLEDITTRYPYFQAAQSIYLKCLKNNNSPLYNRQLQKAASQTTDRSVLFDFITSNGFNQNEISDQIKHRKDTIDQIDVDAEEIIARHEDFNENSDFRKVTDADLFQRKSDLGTRPLEFDKKEIYSFNEWLQLSKIEPIEREETSRIEKTTINLQEKLRRKKMQRIDQFLADKPKITPAKERVPLKSIELETPPSTQLMTETLAQVYVAQKNYEKAIKSYEILVLQHPEKSSFFADRIQEIKNLQSSN
jgi:hypothetical protein